ncbi:hypothetical protein [Pseudonocardia sp.]|uniref:VOC family protein n=1 Tax=Pseudonocardia sp. TaxID=60912 RepID=UPI00260A7EE8|nr:hypothetical protein [Pseudonocardia sp.]
MTTSATRTATTGRQQDAFHVHRGRTRVDQPDLRHLPVADIEASQAFYRSLGFSLDEQLTDETSAYVVVSDTIAVQLATRDEFRGFTGKDVPAGAGVILALGSPRASRSTG